MKKILSFVFVCLFFVPVIKAQELVATANHFIELLNDEQKVKALFPFDAEERYTFFFVPRNDRKGITFNELNAEQKIAAFSFIQSCLSAQTVKKVQQILQMETVLKEIEKRKENDNYRDTGKYYISIFGVPGAKNIWGWRLEGHHTSFHFSAANNKLVSGTPSFLGSNPAIVQNGPTKGLQILKEESDQGFAFLHSLTELQIQKATINSIAPDSIITSNHRVAMLANPQGIMYSELNAAQKQQLLKLINVYVHRYTKLFAEDLLKEIQQAGLDNLHFSWAGNTTEAFGKAYYYSIQGPTVIIEFDNSQNNANHIHTVLRDLKHDFGGDDLLEHYHASHKN